MPNYAVSAIVRLELNAQFEIKAKDQAEADKKAQEIAEKLVVKWEGTERVGKVEIGWDETDESTEVESVDEET